MPRQRTRPGRTQRSIQILDFASTLQRDLAKSLKDNPVVIASAAMVAFAAMPLEQQLEHLTSARRRHAEVVAGA